MAFGVFVDIAQQDGTLTRMHYEGVKPDIVKVVTWIGIMEQTAQKFKTPPPPEG
jgi:hypothetical protein